MEKRTSVCNVQENHDFCWIHITGIKEFLYLGANEYEEKIGQNITIDLSLKIKFTKTEDKLENTTDYGVICQHISEKIRALHKVKLLEYLAEQLLNSIKDKYCQVIAAKISIEKGYVPLKEFTGKVRIEAVKEFI